MEHMGQKLRELLTKKRIKQNEFADTMGVKPQYIHGLLKQEVLSRKSIRKIAVALDVDPKLLFEEGKEDMITAEEDAACYSKKNEYINCERYIIENSSLKTKIIELQDEIIRLNSK